MKNPLHQTLITRGLATIEDIESSEERARLMDAAAEIITDPDLAQRCRVTAACLREAEGAQLRLFKSIRPSA